MFDPVKGVARTCGGQVFQACSGCIAGEDVVLARIKAAGEREGVRVYPHRLRRTCATQPINVGCRVTSIQKFLGHKRVNSTMIYARVHARTVAEDYYAAMEVVEQRLQMPERRPRWKMRSTSHCTATSGQIYYAW